MAATYKIIVYTPLSHGDGIREAIATAGGGRLGKYSHCSFSSKGVGRFLPMDGAQPHIGSVGHLEEVEEERIEVTCAAEIVGNVIAAIKRAHPYEEIAMDIYPLETW